MTDIFKKTTITEDESTWPPKGTPTYNEGKSTWAALATFKTGFDIKCYLGMFWLKPLTSNDIKEERWSSIEKRALDPL